MRVPRGIWRPTVDGASEVNPPASDFLAVPPWGLKMTELEKYRRRDGACQSCGGEAHHHHHKKRRSQGGEDGPENGLALCGICHGFLHAKRDREDLARECAANMAQGGMIPWKAEQIMDLMRWKR